MFRTLKRIEIVGDHVMCYVSIGFYATSAPMIGYDSEVIEPTEFTVRRIYDDSHVEVEHVTGFICNE